MATPIPSKYVIKDCELWLEKGRLKNQDIVIHDQIISEITPTGQKFDNHVIFTPNDALIHPLGVDAQAHLRVPGQKQKETAETGIKAALRGGYGAVLTMPNTQPVIDSPQVCDQAMGEILPWVEKLGVKVYLSAAMTVNQGGQKLVDGEALAHWGVKALTDDGKGVESNDVMEKLFAISEKTGLPLLQHAEMPGHGGVLAPGPVQKKLGVNPYFAKAEVDMVKRDLTLLKKFPKARYHVLHVSSAETVELVAHAKKEGLPVTCEVCPHHLLFTSDDIIESNSSFKMNPPLRSANDRNVLVQGLASGVIDFISTDHAPHESQVKGKQFSTAAFGTTGLETALRALLYLEKEGKLSAKRVVEAFSFGPARFLGIQKDISTLEVGTSFHGVVLEGKSQNFQIKKDELESLSKNNCFLGLPMPGQITRVFNQKGIFEF